jgi:hypothetical protein
MSEDICFEIFFEVVFWIILHAVYEIAVQVLVSLGLSRAAAEGIVLVSALVVIFLFVANTARKRKLLGKAVVLDTDGDGVISEEEEAAAFDHHHDDEEPEEWWESD